MPGGLSGLSALTPAAWWALLALGIPILIHLFSRSRGRLVRIGHIDLIRQARQLQVTEAKLTQWLLLVLRLAIFALAALILVGLAIRGFDDSDAPVIYVTPGWLHSSSEHDIDSLPGVAGQESGSRIYLLQPGFPSLEKEQLIAGRQRSPGGTESFSNVWALLSERLSLQNHSGPVIVYATDYMLQYGARRPALPRSVEWRVSQPGGPPPGGETAPRVLITNDMDRRADAELVISALAVLKEHRLPGLSWRRLDSSPVGEAPVNADWLIHLAAEGPDAAQIASLQRPLVILSDANGADSEDTHGFVSLPFYPFTNFRLDHFTRDVRGDAGDPAVAGANVLLARPDGGPLLQESQYGRTRLVQFHSRFNPGWNSLILQPEFPEFLLQLMAGNTLQSLRFGDARIDPANLPDRPAERVSDIPLPRRSLQGFLATLLALLWVGERWLSERVSREKH